MAVFMLVQFRGDSTNGAWQIADPAVDKGKLIASSTRSPGDSHVKAYSSAIDAALTSYRSVLRFNNGDFQFDVPRSAAMTGDTLSVRLVGNDGEIVDELQGLLPIGLDAVRDSVQVWLLTLPSRQLQRMPVQGQAERIFLSLFVLSGAGWAKRSEPSILLVPTL